MPSAYVQDAISPAPSAASATTISLAFSTANVNAGNMLCATATWGGAVDFQPTCSDNINGPWINGPRVYDPVNHQSLGQWYFPGTLGGSKPTVTISFGGVSKNWRGLHIEEVSGCVKVMPEVLGSANLQANPGTGQNAITSGIVTTSFNGDYVYGYSYSGNGASNMLPGSGFNGRLRWGGLSLAVDRVQGSAGAVATTYTDVAGDASRYLTCCLALQAVQDMPINLKDAENLKILATGYPAISLESMDFFDTIDGTAINTLLWNQSVSTMTITQPAGFVLLNPTTSTTANAYAILSSIQTFFVTSCLPLHFHFDIQASAWAMPANTVMELGWGSVATNAAPTDGVFVRAINGVAYLVANNGGVESQVQIALPSSGLTYEMVLDVYADKARLYIANILAAEIPRGVSQAALVNSNRQPFFLRVYNTATPPASSPTLQLGQISIQQRNANLGVTMGERLIGMGRSCVQNPVTTFGQLAQFANSGAPANATLGNTAASYTTLGGKFLVTGVASAETDFPLFGYQIPAGYQFYLKGISISAWISTVLVGGPLVLEWGLGINASAVSLATTDGAGTWAPRRVAIGQQGFAAAAAAGTSAPDIIRQFQGLLVDGGRFLTVILRMPSGVTSGAVRGSVGFDGYFV